MGEYMNKGKLIFVACVAVLISGCAGEAPRPFTQVSQNEPHATLVLETVDHRVTQQLRVFRFRGALAGPRCSAEEPEIIAVLNNTGWADKSYADKGENVKSVRVAVPVDTPFRISSILNADVQVVTNGLHIQLCQANASFMPRAGHTYKARLDPHVSTCSWRVTEIAANGEESNASSEAFPPCIFMNNAGNPWNDFVNQYYSSHPERYK